MILDLADTIDDSPHQRRLNGLRQVTDLFLHDAEALNEEQIDLFDVVITRLANAIETSARVELASRLAPIASAPRGIIKSLAQDQILVARAVLTQSSRLTDEDLVAIALAKGRDHMLAMTERPVLSEHLTDVLVTRGDRVVVHAVAGNPGAKFSANGMTTLVDRSRADEALQTLLTRRQDIPEAHMHQLIAIAKETARQRLSEALPETTSEDVDSAVEKSTKAVSAAISTGNRDYAIAMRIVSALSQERRMGENDLIALAQNGKKEEAICLMALLTGLSVPSTERLVFSNELDLILVVAKAQNWMWETVKALLYVRSGHDVPFHTLKTSEKNYEQLSVDTAQRVMHFLKVKEKAQKEAADEAAARHLRSKVR
jgi:uncharacterized protein (DUF2336 family)